MARKKEPQLEIKNKEAIVAIAKELFLKNGIENTTMNDIAKSAGMSKSTLYVYFKSRQEVKNYLSLEAMEYLYQQLKDSLQRESTPKAGFMAVCNVFVEFKEKYPLNFELLVQEICVDEKVLSEDAVLKKIYETGEMVNQLIFSFFGSQMSMKDEREMFLKIFEIWGTIYGIITLADNKEKYMYKAYQVTKEEFLSMNFENVYRSIDWRKD